MHKHEQVVDGMAAVQAFFASLGMQVSVRMDMVTQFRICIKVLYWDDTVIIYKYEAGSCRC